MSLFLVPADRKNLEKSIERDVPPGRLVDAKVSSDALQEIQAQAGAEGIRCWAMTPAKRTTFNKMKPGDLVLLSESGTGKFTHAAWVTFKLENKELGDALWPFKGQSSWELIYFLHRIQRIDVPKQKLVTKLDYNPEYPVYGTTPVRDEQVQKFERVNGPLTEWLGLSYSAELPATPRPSPGVAEGDASDYSATDVLAEAKRRVGHDAFANRVKANYRMTCAMCGITEEKFLVASHISPWSKDVLNRLNPANGICLCVLHDRAFEAGYLILDEELRIQLTPQTRPGSPLWQQLESVVGRLLRRPTAAPPAPDLLKRHRDTFLQDAPPRKHEAPGA